MPAGDVVISAAFSQTPVKSSELAILDVSVSAVVTPKLLSGQYTYTADIPHIIPTAVSSEEDEDQSDEDGDSAAPTFSIIAIPEDPQAEVTITPASGEPSDNAEYELTEGKTVYTIKVEREGVVPPVNTYNFTVSYWPELALSSIELSSSGNDGWKHKIPVQDKQDVLLPYDSLTITAALPEENGVTVSASKTGDGALTGDGPWTLEYTGGAAFSSVVTITSSKHNYEKKYILNITKPAEEEASKIPTTFWAASDGGGSKAIILDGEEYYEVHTFLSSGKLTVSQVPTEGLSAQVLVVAGGGGGGAATYPSSGGGAGGMIEANNYSLAAQTYDVVVGLGGAGGKNSSDTNSGDVTDGKNGGDSSFGAEFTAKGGGGGAKHKGTEGSAGNAGGSSGGGSASPSVSAATLPESNAISYGNVGGSTGTPENNNKAAGGGGAGGPGSLGNVSKTSASYNFGGEGRMNNINGTEVIYAAGGGIASAKGIETTVYGASGDANTGNGGGGAWNRSGGGGGSGIVIVRFPARPNE